MSAFEARHTAIMPLCPTCDAQVALLTYGLLITLERLAAALFGVAS